MKIKNIKREAFLKNLEKAYTEGIYADTPANRKLGRVGMSYKEWTQKQAGGGSDDKNDKKDEVNTDTAFDNDFKKNLEDLKNESQTEMDFVLNGEHFTLTLGRRGSLKLENSEGEGYYALDHSLFDVDEKDFQDVYESIKQTAIPLLKNKKEENLNKKEENLNKKEEHSNEKDNKSSKDKINYHKKTVSFLEKNKEELNKLKKDISNIDSTKNLKNWFKENKNKYSILKNAKQNKLGSYIYIPKGDLIFKVVTLGGKYDLTLMRYKDGGEVIIDNNNKNFANQLIEKVKDSNYQPKNSHNKSILNTKYGEILFPQDKNIEYRNENIPSIFSYFNNKGKKTMQKYGPLFTDLEKVLPYGIKNIDFDIKNGSIRNVSIESQPHYMEGGKIEGKDFLGKKEINYIKNKLENKKLKDLREEIKEEVKQMNKINKKYEGKVSQEWLAKKEFFNKKFKK